LRDTQGGNDSEENARCHGERNGESKDATIDSGTGEWRDSGRYEAREKWRPKRGEQHASGSCDCCEQDAFGEHLASDSRTAGTKGEAHGEFTAAAGGSREQQIRDVRAGNQEHKTDCAKQDQKRRAHVARQFFAKRNGDRANFLVILGMFFLKLFCDGRKICICCCEGNSRLQSSNDFKKMASVVGQLLLCEPDGRQEFGFEIVKLQSSRRYADDGELLAIEPNLFPDGPFFAAEPPYP